MNPSKFTACPSCGKALEQADVFDQIAGFSHADCACGYCTKQAAGAQLVQDAEAEMFGPIGEGQALLELYGKASTEDEVNSWALLARGTIERFVRGFEEYQFLASKHGRAASAWHGNADDKQGEGPRSGGGGATSGAGAQRKEGVQPPDDSTSAMEVSA